MKCRFTIAVFMTLLITSSLYPQNGKNWFFNYKKIGLINKDRQDSLVIKAEGKNIDSLQIEFEIWSDSKKVYSNSWQSIDYFQYDDNNNLSYKEKESKILKELNNFFNKDSFNTFDYKPVKSWPSEDSEINENFETINWNINYEFARDSLMNIGYSGTQLENQSLDYARRSNVKRLQTINIWNDLSVNKPVTFTFFSGGENNETICWSKKLNKFIVIWSCC